ncbi:MAG: ATP-binding cassette domain-containing protein [Candidatus Solibacter usitatus]|nr:ATP-binding cassette domain-containing protein [Candidatus Solibacter usitatus]
MTEPPLLDFRNITVSHDGHIGLNNLSLTIHAHEHIALLGPNGSGKSTLIKTLTRDCYPLWRADSHVRIFDRENWNIFHLRPLFGIVHNDLMQSYIRYPYSGREVILSGFFSSVGIWPNHEVTAAMQARAEEILNLMEIPHLADRIVNETSTGEGRRLLIGRALVHRPRALILDEPTASLDIRATAELIAILRKVAAETTIILVTHHLSDIIPEISRVVLLRKGSVFRDGRKSDVLSSETLSELFEMPVEVLERGGYYHLIQGSFETA